MKVTHRRKSAANIIAFRTHKAPAYPNAAERSYLAHRLLDYFLTAASSAGIVTALMYMIAFC